MYVEMTKCEQLDKLMSESRRRKTRRGKKNSVKRIGLSCEKGQLKRYHNVLPVTKSQQRPTLRPAASPPAPFNTNQFLIEDRKEIMLLDSSPSQTLPLEEESFYDSPEHDVTCGDNLSLFKEDSYYEPLWISDANDDFMLKEFEKDYMYNAAFDLETHFQSRLNVYEDLSKEELVKKIMDLEKRCLKTRLNHTEPSEIPNSFENIITDLKTENSRLKEENEELRSALLFR